MSADLVPITGPTASREEWLAARRQGIGGSDVSAILGLNRYRTPLAVWLDKTSPEPVDDSAGEAAEWGNRLEPVIAARWAEGHPGYEVPPCSPGLLARADLPWALATPDRLVTSPNGSRELWEGKTAGSRQAHRWDDDALPDEYALQVHWYLTVLDLNVGHVSALLAGQKYVERTIDRDHDLSDTLVRRVGEWWQRHVVDGVMPDPDPQRDSELIGRLWEGSDVDPADLEPLADTVLDLRAVRASLEHLKAQEADLVSQIKLALGDHTEGRIGGDTVVTWRPSKARESLDVKALRANEPDVAARYSRTGNPVRSFLLKDVTP